MPFFQGGADTTKPSPRILRTFDELKVWKRQLITAHEQLVTYTTATSDLGAALDRPLYAFPRVYDWGPDSTSLKSSGPTALLKSGYEHAGSPADKMVKAPSTAIMAQLQAALSRDVHKPIKDWHERYKKLREEVHVDLDAVRKKYDATTLDLIKAKKAQDKERRKEHATLVEQMQTNVNVKTQIRADAWAAYVEAEIKVYSTANALAEDAHEASKHLTKAAAAIAAAMSDMAQRFANTGTGAGGGAGSPGVAQPMQRMSLNEGNLFSRKMSVASEQSMYGQGAGGAQPGWHDEPSGSMRSAPSSNFGEEYTEVPLGVGGGRYGISTDGGGQGAPGQEPWPDTHSASGSGRHSRRSSESSSQGLPADSVAGDGYVAIGTYGMPAPPAVGYPSPGRAPLPSAAANARWYQQSSQAGTNAGKGSWATAAANGAASTTGYTRPNLHQDVRTSAQSDTSDASLAAAAGGVPSPQAAYGMNNTTRMTLPYTPESVGSQSEIGDEETPVGEKGIGGPFQRKIRQFDSMK